MPPTTVIIHERLGRWARQLRPRLASWPIRWAETRSTRSVADAVASSAWPILVLDLGDQPIPMLEDLGVATRDTNAILSLVLNPRAIAEVPQLAREIGATFVIDGPVVPPRVEALLLRWLPIARERAVGAGWSRPQPPDPQPWDVPLPLAR